MKLLFFAHDPGGANAIAPLISKFEKPYVFGKGPALNILPGAIELFTDNLRWLKPDFLISGTSANDFTERQLWQEAKFRGIPSMAILDAWSNYGIRFSKYGTRNLHLFKGICNYFPDYICVMDEFAKTEMIKDGVPADRIVTFGNPHFEIISLVSKQVDYTSEANGEINKEIIFLFASEPFEDVYHKGQEELVLQGLLKAARMYKKARVRIRNHPKEPSNKYMHFVGDRIEIDKNESAYDSIKQASIVVSASSMVLLEAMILGRKIVSFQPKAKNGKNDFILTRNGTLPFLQNYKEFENYLSDVLNNHTIQNFANIPYEGTIDRIVSFVKEVVHGKAGY